LNVVKYSEDVSFELLELRSFEDGSANSDHAGLDFADGHEWSGGGKRNPAQDGQCDRYGNSSSFHEVVDSLSGKTSPLFSVISTNCFLVKEKGLRNGSNVDTS
jgi:hypothetical protein